MTREELRTLTKDLSSWEAGELLEVIAEEQEWAIFAYSSEDVAMRRHTLDDRNNDSEIETNTKIIQAFHVDDGVGERLGEELEDFIQNFEREKNHA